MECAHYRTYKRVSIRIWLWCLCDFNTHRYEPANYRTDPTRTLLIPIRTQWDECQISAGKKAKFVPESLKQFTASSRHAKNHSGDGAKPAYSIALNSISANICAKIKKTATVTPAPAMIDACWRMNSVVTFRHPLMCSVSGDGASMHGFRCPPYVSWQHDSGMLPYQSRYDSMPQQRSRVCVSSQANVMARRLPYSGSVEYISWRIVWMTFSRNT